MKAFELVGCRPAVVLAMFSLPDTRFALGDKSK